jgi:putative acyl-CoA dehydrogenase
VREALFAELSLARGADSSFDREVSRLNVALDDPGTWEVRSRDLVERMALCLQGSLLLRAGDAVVAQAFCESRLGGGRGQVFGTLAAHTRFDHLIDRAWAD